MPAGKSSIVRGVSEGPCGAIPISMAGGLDRPARPHARSTAVAAALGKGRKHMPAAVVERQGIDPAHGGERQVGVEMRE